MGRVTVLVPPLARARFITVAGTHGAGNPAGWDRPDSAFVRSVCTPQGYYPLRDDPTQCYAWTTGLDGVRGPHHTWRICGLNLFQYIVPPLGTGVPAIPPADTNILCFSHGLQVVMFACGEYGLKVNGLISVGSPIRGDLTDLYERASDNIRTHVHLYSRGRDLWQIAGALFDGRWGIHRKFPYTAYNFAVLGGHGAILSDEKYYPLWKYEGWLKAFDPQPLPELT